MKFFKKIALFILMGTLATGAWAAPMNPNDFIESISQKGLKATLSNERALKGDLDGIQEIVQDYIMPYVDMNKATRLTVGMSWRQATNQQKDALIKGFQKTLMRTYSGAFKMIDKKTQVLMLPFRGNPQAKDVIVSSVFQTGATRVRVDYRMYQKGDQWLIYDFAVEGVWLIQNYRNQFAEQIRRNGIDGLISALNRN